jgi:hypothetical protein
MARRPPRNRRLVPKPEPRRAERSLRALLSDRRAVPVIVALGILLAIPSLDGGFYQDDYNLLVALRRGVRPFYDLYRFATGDPAKNQALIASGDYPFWIAKDFKLHLIRPLTSALFSLDHASFGEHPLGYHLDTLVWYAALLTAAGVFFRRVLPPTAATLALLVFTLRASHTLAFAWISTRHVLVAAVPSVLAMLAHIRAEREGSKRAQVGATCLLALGLTGSEVALGIVPFWIGFDLVEARAKGDWRRAIKPSAPALVVTVAYLAAYGALGGGAHAALGYRDPIADPGAFLDVALPRIPVYLGDALLGIPAEIGGRFPVVESVAIALVAIALCALVLRAMSPERRKEAAALVWLVPAAVLALGPGLATLWGHALVISDLGFSALIGVLFVAAGEGMSDPARPMRRLGLASAALVLAVCHWIVPPFVTLRTTAAVARRAEIATTMAMSAELDGPPAKTAFLVGAPDAITYFYARDVIEALAPERLACWSTLTPTNGGYRLMRTGPRTLMLGEVEPSRDNAYSSFFAGKRSFVVGEEVEQCGAKIRVEAVRFGTPSILRIETADSLDDGKIELLVTKDFRVRRVPMPAIGETVHLPRLDWGT